MLPLLRHTLARALTHVKPDMGECGPRLVGWYSWETRVREAVFVAFTRDLQGDHIDLLRRACCQIDQQGKIDWDEPVTEWDREQEEPYLHPERKKAMEIEKKHQSHIAYMKRLEPLILTPDQEKKFFDPNYNFPKMGNRMKEMLKYLPPELEHNAYEWGVSSGGDGWQSNATLVNSWVRHGIVKYINAKTRLIRTGPQYERALYLFRQQPAPHDGNLIVRIVNAGIDMEYYRKVGRGEIPPKYPHE